MINTANEWQSYKVVEHETMGYSLFMWAKDAQMWQQCTKWYSKFGNLKRHVLKKYGYRLI